MILPAFFYLFNAYLKFKIFKCDSQCYSRLSKIINIFTNTSMLYALYLRVRVGKIRCLLNMCKCVSTTMNDHGKVPDLNSHTQRMTIYVRLRASKSRLKASEN